MAAMAGSIPPLRLALAQIDSRVGDIAGNAELIRTRTAEAREAGAELVLFPELALTGYPPEDLLFKAHFLAATRGRWPRGRASRGITAVVGFVDERDDIYNAPAVLRRRRACTAIYHKRYCPTTACSTRSATSSPGRRRRSSPSARR